MSDADPVAVACPPLDYRMPAAAPPLPPPWRTAYAYVALTCWAVPLVAGVGVWLASEVVRLRDPAGCKLLHKGGPPMDRTFALLVDLGLYDLAVGVGLFGVGSVAVIAFVVARWGTAASRFWQVSTPAAVGLGLLASNFVAAATVLAAVSR